MITNFLINLKKDHSPITPAIINKRTAAVIPTPMLMPTSLLVNGGSVTFDCEESPVVVAGLIVIEVVVMLVEEVLGSGDRVNHF